MAKTARKKFYFAYGSNCNLQQMARRCPNAEKVAVVTLPDYTLTFNGRHDGSGVASIKPQKGAKVVGLLWAITPLCERSLDIYEGFPGLYGKDTVTVQTASGERIDAMVYIMTPAHNSPAMPSQMYYIGILDGFQENGISPATLNDALIKTAELTRRKGVG